MTELQNSGVERRITAFDVVRLVLAAILLIAAALKAYPLATEPVANKDIFSYRWSLMLQVEFEIVFGLWLLSGAYRRLAWALAVACFTFFCGVTLYKALSGEASCGCFGKVQVDPWYTLILDTSAVAALLLFRPQAAPRQAAPVDSAPQGQQRRLAVALLLAVLVGIPAGIAMASYKPATILPDGKFFGTGSIVLLEPEKWVGQPLPIRDFITGVNLDQGDWVVLLVDHDCPDCRRTMADYRRPAAQTLAADQGLHVAFIEVPPYGLPPETPGSLIARGTLTNEKEWFVTTPVVLLVRGGMVNAVWQEKTAPKLETIVGGRPQAPGRARAAGAMSSL